MATICAGVEALRTNFGTGIPPELWNSVKLETLKGLLDRATLTDFQAKFEANGGVTFADFWDEIDCEFGRDANHQNKQE